MASLLAITRVGRTGRWSGHHARLSIQPWRPLSPCNVQNRGILGWSKSKDSTKSVPKPVVLAQNDLFHPFSQSPIASMRARGETVKSLAPCPVCLEVHKERKAVQHECPDCGWPTHCTETHWSEDAEHKKYCGRLREVNEDEHDLRSGRRISEFDMPGS
jgi:splicing suppressor protein 51